eukprot:CAMPEP_0175082736 /NCGR_PEP_ID=MMETSP0052_2-20121109/26931_1 /TAXON_ID=51329 ORGANISM="Polytomella parva, Strain SAG 63-3" /NCGR_SAMPLE_ID=MMETSP0052_2 /ASSEMBLY_ACC=CAM_ASM_000194 /LENGTH=874 /DNA_ID=CAMNT_0016353985 /DNA_START=29 /DNA_END=2653 /DNA_ORIENTATION=-
MESKLNEDLLTDVSTSEAFLIINKLLEKNEITPDKTRESQVVTLSDKDDSIDSLREDVEMALSEAAIAQERQQLLQLEAADLQRQRADLAARIEELSKEQAEALTPMISGLKMETIQLATDHEEEVMRLAAVHRDVELMQQKIESVKSQAALLQSVKIAEKTALQKAENLPEKAKRQAEATAAMLRNYQAQLNQANADLAETEEKQKAQIQRDRDFGEDHQRQVIALERARLQLETKGRHVDDIRKDCELASLDADKLLADQAELDIKLKGSTLQLRSENEAVARKQREKDLILRQFRAAEVDLKEIREELPNIRIQVEQAKRDVHNAEALRKSQEVSIKEVKADLDIHMAQFLVTEAVGKERVIEFQETFSEVAALEQELVALRKEEADRKFLIRDLGHARDRASMGTAAKISKVKEAKMATRVKDIELEELKKSWKDVNRRIRDFEKLYDLIKNQRNKFVNLIQAAQQNTTEMRDKLKILNNELDILHAEVHSKDKLLSQSRGQHTSAVTDRDSLRTELGKMAVTFRDKQSAVDKQISEIDKLNAIINTMEKEMIKLKKQYEIVIEARNYTGVMLIDRNDELCVLYEKSAILGEVSRRGDLELSRREDIARILRIEAAELQRSVDVTKRTSVPQIPMALLETRRESEKLSEMLENPSNQSRWRLLEGKIPDREELAAKTQHLEERLNDKKEQLLEKELILGEITHLSDKLRLQAAEGRADTLELAKRVNEYQSKLRAMTRKIMATVSELSMFQATSLKLGAEHEELETVVEAARNRLNEGLPPTDEAEEEWLRMVREAETISDLAERNATQEAALASKASQVQSTADPRPNAYIPESLGIPKPYGGFSPFKPSETGSTMRHIRKPQPKEVII